MTLLKHNLLSLAGGAVAATLAFAVPGGAPHAQTPAAAPAPAASDLDRAVAALRGISTLRADFTQTDRNGQRLTGVLTLKRPGRIRFQYQRGVPLLIVSDGRALTLVDYEVKQVQRWPISNSPLGALLDPRRDVARYGTLEPVTNPDVVRVRVKDKAHPEYGTITLIFLRNAAAPGGLQLTHWVALDSQNAMTRIDLADHQYGLAVPDNTFRFNDPRGSARR